MCVYTRSCRFLICPKRTHVSSICATMCKYDHPAVDSKCKSKYERKASHVISYNFIDSPK